MFKYVLIAGAASLTLGFATAASAAPITSVTGIVVLNGHVDAQCSVVTAGAPPAGATFGDTYTFPALADANGHLLTGLAYNSTTNVGSFQVNCTGANNTVTLVATPLATNPVVNAPGGYANTINYTAEADFSVVGGSATSPVKLIQDSTVAAPLSQTLGANTRLANPGVNVAISASTFNTAAPSDILVAGDYVGQITVTISAGV